MYKKKVVYGDLTILIVLSAFLSLFISVLIHNGVFGFSKDSYNYQDMIGTLIARGCKNSDGSYVLPGVEFGFQEEVCFLSRISQDVKVIYSSQIFISIFLKLIFFSIIFLHKSNNQLKPFYKLSPILIGLLAYFLRYFPLHDFTQLRISIAIGFLVGCCAFLKLTPVVNYNLEKEQNPTNIFKSYTNILWQQKFRIFSILLLLFASFSFHHSIAIVVPFLLISMRVENKRQFVVSMLSVLAICIIFSSFVHTFVFNNIEFAAEQKKYVDFDDNNPFSILKILDIITIVIAYNVINFKVPIQVFFLSLFTCSLIIFYSLLLNGLPTAYILRLADIFSVFNVFLIASLESKREMTCLIPVVLAASFKTFSHYLNESYFMFP